MSSFYTVSTNNAFAALDMSDDERRIRPISEAPKVVEEVVEAPKKESPARRGGPSRGGAFRFPRQDGQEPQEDGVDDRNSRLRAPRGGKRGGRGDNFAPREGKRTFDKKTTPAHKKAEEDTNPAHEAEDEAAAELIAKAEENDRSEDVVEEKEEKAPAKMTVQQYLSSLEAERVAQAEAAAPVDAYTDLNREIADAGFKPLDNTKEEVGGRAPGASKTKKSQNERKAQDVFAAVGAIPQLARPDNRSDDRKPRKERDSSKSSSAPAKETKKALKDDQEYPSLF